MLNIIYVAAQPISLTFAKHGIYPGEAYNFFIVDTTTTKFDPGTGGINKTWIFNNLDIGTNLQTQTYIDPATTPFASSFPTATIALKQGDNYAYYKSNSTGLYTEGFAAALSYTVRYLDNEKMFAYPFTYGTPSPKDAFSGSDVVSQPDLIYKTSGDITTTCDGWGTLIINGHTIPNVLRFKIVQLFNESQIQVSTEDTLAKHTETTNYHWYSLDNKNPLINYTYIVSYDPNDPETKTINKMTFIDQKVVGINDKTPDPVNLFLYPNPTTGFVNLETNYSSPQKLNIELTNTNGQVVYTDLYSAKAGRSVQKLDVSALPQGIYSIRIFNNESVIVRKLILQ